MGRIGEKSKAGMEKMGKIEKSRRGASLTLRLEKRQACDATPVSAAAVNRFFRSRRLNRRRPRARESARKFRRSSKGCRANCGADRAGSRRSTRRAARRGRRVRDRRNRKSRRAFGRESVPASKRNERSRCLCRSAAGVYGLAPTTGNAKRPSVARLERATRRNGARRPYSKSAANRDA